MNPRPIRVTPKEDYKPEIEFSNKEAQIFDMSPHLDFGVFKELKDIGYFLQAKVRTAQQLDPASKTLAQIGSSRGPVTTSDGPLEYLIH